MSSSPLISAIPGGDACKSKAIVHVTILDKNCDGTTEQSDNNNDNNDNSSNNNNYYQHHQCQQHHQHKHGEAHSQRLPRPPSLSEMSCDSLGSSLASPEHKGTTSGSSSTRHNPYGSNVMTPDAEEHEDDQPQQQQVYPRVVDFYPLHQVRNPAAAYPNTKAVQYRQYEHQHQQQQQQFYYYSNPISQDSVVSHGNSCHSIDPAAAGHFTPSPNGLTPHSASPNNNNGVYYTGATASPQQQQQLHNGNGRQRKHQPQGGRRNGSNNNNKRAWNQIPHPGVLTDGATLTPGHHVDVYDGHLTQYYCIKSEDVFVTHGSIRYVEHFNDCGPYTRFRFQICHNFLTDRCTKGVNCTYIHVRQLPECCVLHVNGVDAYERLPPGGSLMVHWPHSTQAPQPIPTESVLYTEGAAKALQAAATNNAQSNNFRPQHCAHFQFKKLCNRGYSCNFIHSLNFVNSGN